MALVVAMAGMMLPAIAEPHKNTGEHSEITCNHIDTPQKERTTVSLLGAYTSGSLPITSKVKGRVLQGGYSMVRLRYYNSVLQPSPRKDPDTSPPLDKKNGGMEKTAYT